MILAPTTYIFFASTIHVITFEEQLEKDTDGKITTAQTLVSTALCGVIYSTIGRTSIVDSWCCRAYCYNVHLHFNFAKGRLDLVSKLSIIITIFVTNSIKL